MAPVTELAQLIDAEISGDRVNPSGEARLVFELSGVLDDAQKNVLRHVFGDALVAELAHGEIEDRRFVPTHQLGERFTIAALVAHHQHFIGGFGPGSRHPGHRFSRAGRCRPSSRGGARESVGGGPGGRICRTCVHRIRSEVSAVFSTVTRPSVAQQASPTRPRAVCVLVAIDVGVPLCVRFAL